MNKIIMLTSDGSINHIETIDSNILKIISKQIKEELNIRASKEIDSTKRKPREPKGE